MCSLRCLWPIVKHLARFLAEMSKKVGPKIDRNVFAFIFGVLVTVIIYKVATIESYANREVINWSEISAESMTGHQIFEYLKWKNSSSCQLMNYFGGFYNLETLKTNPGIDGQKAVCLDYQFMPFEECVAYSFRINGEWSFEETMKKYGCEVYAFDPSTNMTNHIRSDGITFYNMGIGDEDLKVPLEEEGKVWTLRTLSAVHKVLRPKHGKLIIDYLRISMDGGEWNVISNIVKTGMLPQIRQMGVTIHMSPYEDTIAHYRSLVKILQLLESHGMVRFDSLINLSSYAFFSVFGLKDYGTYEIAWYNAHIHARDTKTVQ